MRIINSFMLCLLLLSCTDKPIFQSEAVLSENSWAYEDPLIFNFEISDTLQAHQFLMDIVHSSEFAFENMYLKLTTSFPDGKSISDIMPIQFSDKMGKWIGKCNGENCTLEVLMQENFFFQSIGSYELKFEQYSRIDTLTGISKLKMKILKSN